MHTQRLYLVKDRRYHFRNYNCCFVGTETVDWLISTKQAPDRDTATYLMNILLDNNVIHHVCDDHKFKDDMLFYRFRKDDGTFPWHKDTAIFLRAQQIFNKLLTDRKTVLGTHQEDGQTYPLSFLGSRLVDWLVANKEAASRDFAIKEGRKLLENGIIRHVTDDHHFKDEALSYQFIKDLKKKRDLMELVLPQRSEVTESQTEEGSGKENSRKAISIDISQAKAGRVTRVTRTESESRKESGYSSGSDQDRGGLSPASSLGSPVFGPGDLVVDASPRQQTLAINTLSVLIRKASCEELEDPNTIYLKKHIRIQSDDVGFGFVIRGEGPVYIQTIDPTGPAFSAGLKVGHYIYSVNDQVVVRMNHRDLAHVILAGVTQVNLVVMYHPRDCHIFL